MCPRFGRLLYNVLKGHTVLSTRSACSDCLRSAALPFSAAYLYFVTVGCITLPLPFVIRSTSVLAAAVSL